MEAMSPADTCRGGSMRGGGDRQSSDPSSPEFEFWMVRNPSLPQPDLPTAEELFVDGVILPLRLRHQHPSVIEQELEQEQEQATQPPGPSPAASDPLSPASSSLSSSASLASSAPFPSKRWKDIFRGAGREKKAEEKDRRRSRKKSAGGVAELNINIWPFSRSRSAGTGSSRARGVAASGATGRRVSSAPCSRSNSRGETCKPPAAATHAAPAAALTHAARRWTTSPGRSGLGVHIGRASPVWQPRKATKKPHPVATGFFRTSGASGNRRAGRGGGGLKVNADLNACGEFSHEARCGVENKRCSEGSEEIAAGGGSGNGSHFTSLRAFFSKVF
ncbi:unnamed protein product [Spirodela intermedia]|uniref:Uncharacterized protein n=1 Tax=Spirodela intermedia TaxID=51605 RepID=A0A7I8KEQ7_SPIIN|nr:unnamed protein product [Spirodela intermedia]